MLATKWIARVAIVAGFLALMTTGAGAVTLNVVGGGLANVASTYGCPTASGTCVLAARDYSLAADAVAVGSITINPAGTAIDIELLVGTANFTGSGGPISFGPATYLASIGNASVSTTPTSASGTGNGTVSGDVNGIPFSISGASVTISCNYPGGTGQCGISFGESGFSDVLGHDWRHQFDVTVALPEPTTALLVALGLVGLALRSRGV